MSRLRLLRFHADLLNNLFLLGRPSSRHVPMLREHFLIVVHLLRCVKVFHIGLAAGEVPLLALSSVPAQIHRPGEFHGRSRRTVQTDIEMIIVNHLDPPRGGGAQR